MSQAAKRSIPSVKLISNQVVPGIEISLDVPDDLSLYLDAQRMQGTALAGGVLDPG